jgi:hypothetical protein
MRRINRLNSTGAGGLPTISTSNAKFKGMLIDAGQ